MINDFSKEFYELNQFLGCNFFQSWAALYPWKGEKPNFEVIVRQFKAETPKLVDLVTSDIEKILSMQLSESELKDIIDKSTGSGFSPLKTRRAFLQRILEILEEPESTKESPITK